jgi:hypothetical protein
MRNTGLVCFLASRARGYGKGCRISWVFFAYEDNGEMGSVYLSFCSIDTPNVPSHAHAHAKRGFVIYIPLLVTKKI